MERLWALHHYYIIIIFSHFPEKKRNFSFTSLKKRKKQFVILDSGKTLRHIGRYLSLLTSHFLEWKTLTEEQPPCLHFIWEEEENKKNIY